MALVIVQLGHCYRTRGATGTGGVDGDPNEQEFATAAGKAALRRLADVGHRCRLILADAPDSEYRGGDVFVAVHCDGSVHETARGASVGYRNTLGQEIGGLWKAAYHAAGWSGGWRPDNYTAALAGYYGTRRAVDQGTKRAFIVECGFLTSPHDERLLWPEGPDRFAIALTAAVVDLFGGRIEEDDMFDDEDRDRAKRTLILLRDGLLDPTEHKAGRANAKTLVQGALLDGLRRSEAAGDGRGTLREPFKELLREVLVEQNTPEVPEPPVPA